eukprot:1682903-Prymnesium_polylepis.1
MAEKSRGSAGVRVDGFTQQSTIRTVRSKELCLSMPLHECLEYRFLSGYERGVTMYCKAVTRDIS